MHIKLSPLLLLLQLLLCPTLATAQERERTVLVGAGAQNVLDTYLSPLEYTGTNISFHSSSRRSLSDKHADWQFQRSCWADLGFVSSPTDDNDEWDGQLQFDWAWRYRWKIAEGLQLWAGPMAEVGAGFTYSMRGGNNPAQGRIALALGGSAVARYDFKLWKKPLRLEGRADVPLLGAAFTPRYGQSYYEIFSLGHYDANIQLTHVGNAPTARLLCTLSAPIGRSRLHIGYRGEARQSQLHHLKRHSWLNTLMIGYSYSFRILRQ